MTSTNSTPRMLTYHNALSGDDVTDMTFNSANHYANFNLNFSGGRELSKYARDNFKHANGDYTVIFDNIPPELRLRAYFRLKYGFEKPDNF